MGMESLLERSLLLQLNKLLPRKSDDEKALHKLDRRLEASQKRVPERCGARQLFFKDLSDVDSQLLSVVGSATQAREVA